MLANWLKESTTTVVFTGAGMSTESGLPDFRSAKTGLWHTKNPQQLASTYALKHNREEFVAFYQYRIRTLLECQPHIGHTILADWQKRGIIHQIVTQNVDGFHQQAGSTNVVELHGTLRTVYCLRCKQTYDVKRYVDEQFECTCGGFLRPSVVLFGESLPSFAIDQAWTAAQQADLWIVLGSSLQVSPANELPVIAKRSGAKLVIVNMEPTELDDWADLTIHNRKIGDVLQEIDHALR
ncbi:NAD-dependent deacetylase [Anoxybacillus voinovskiensis]|uniref:NAD-dependent protein deacetylase n=1 Tax=Anoxybacteroides voinovskiense TaxID=230470 RepID=A0A840DLW5_9BACL|nr:NAD-dependent deacylase [Anoxybacillus voinovskiensis]MBB4072492.1 NAD-dependent deacetylase [Anoxybacillus voinovskiensis]GGJ57427.1 NAD-dependent deacetylase [Anoxybacillus voinovskiensis]